MFEQLAKNSATLKFRFAGFRLIKAIFDQIDFGAQDSQGYRDVYDEYVHLKNCQLMEPDATLGLNYTVDYIRLMRNVRTLNGKLPSCFFKKFSGIQYGLAEGLVQDANHILRFLKSLSLLRGLTIRFSRLAQEVYDQLPASAHSLTRLNLVGKNGQQLNFGFITQFSRLGHLAIQSSMCFESFASLVSCLQVVRQIERGLLSFKKTSSKKFLGLKRAPKSSVRREVRRIVGLVSIRPVGCCPNFVIFLLNQATCQPNYLRSYRVRLFFSISRGFNLETSSRK